MGKEQTPKPFVSACTKFKYIDILAGDKEKKKAGKTKTEKAEKSTLTKETEIKNSIRTIIDENSDADGWVLASTVGTLMQNKYPDFDCRNYGCKKMIDLLKKFGFETKVSKDKTTYFVK